MMTMLQNGDCLDEMRDLADGCVDAIVTDPPYGLSFMGKDWDYGVPGEAFWKEALRVAKPGAHLLAFGGTRTYHRLACAIEDAGWEVRDCIMWVYGCLSEDSEILTCKGWAKIGTIQVGDKVHAYDRTTRTFRYEEVKDTFLYDYDDTAYRIQSDSTDQLVSRNHRVIVERGGVEVFEYAENLAQEYETRVPVLEGLQSLLDHISMLNERAGSSQQDMFAGMCGGINETSPSQALGRPFTEQDMPRLREGVLRPSCMAEKGKNKLLLSKLQEQGRVRSSSNETQQGTPNYDNGGAETDFKSTDDRRSESRMERRSDIPTPQRELCECSVCALPKGVSANGSKGRVCDGTSACSSESNRSPSEANGGCTSHQPQSAGQQGRESDVILDEPSAQTLRGAWRTTTTLARITPVHYKGRMWCVSVPSGAIVARRNGKVFVTGNSGFPKSMDVSKAIDKAMGAERKVVGKSNRGCGANLVKIQNHGKGDTGIGFWDGTGKTFDITAPATPEAAAWNGWGTQLKPACEPIVIARKPLEGTVAANVLKYGTGAINIDGCRVPTEETVVVHSPTHKTLLDSGHKDLGTWENNKGRFPANLIHDGSDEVLACFPDNVKGGTWNNTKGARHFENNGKPTEYVNKGKDNSIGSAARFFYCAKASRSERGEGNLHPTVKPLALMRYLVRLVTRKGGIVLDPFMGSGTTGVAAIQEGMNFIGIEKDQHYYEIAQRRMSQAKREPEGPIQLDLFAQTEGEKPCS